MLTILAKVLDAVPSWLWAIVAAALLAVVVGLNINLAMAHHQVAELTIKSQDLELTIARSEARAATQSAAYQTQTSKAKDEASIRESTLRNLAVVAGSESAGLRNDLAALRRNLANATREAAIERATALSTVLGQCSERYTGLAQTCDRHVSDLKTLIDSWPTAP